jgi:TetR/AcrR family fatty acid metabolism transcriptional regulator
VVNPSRWEARKEQILKAAERIFARKGFPEATISDVAKEAGVSDATIYEYFSSKEELLFSIPGETTRKGKEMLEFHLNYVRGAANKLRSIIYHYLWFYQNHPDYASVAMLILKQNRKFLETEAYQVVREGSRIILRVVEEGIASGEFRQDVNPYLVRSVILGTIEHMVIRWLLHGSPKDLLWAVDPLTDLVIQGIRKASPPPGWNLRISLEPDVCPGGDATDASALAVESNPQHRSSSGEGS